ncbi:MAG: LL-diaminopimelate aminotransferase [Chlamydiales bacterium]|nr:LL-diaminopimelate aminotransferase [Chlamydiales bacterium]MCH9635986.1 LL-diaminopimelate aminotransferase [Chlamydiales bacterium]MCH9704304.1 LL-diaminopimelate aminotransferase [Chlamydiota bacterium]
MVRRNPNFECLEPSYLFRRIGEIAKRYDDILDLSIGDASLPILPNISEAMQKKAMELSTKSGFCGYGEGQGNAQLRELIAKRYSVEPDEIFISDGAKSDIGRIGQLFGPNLRVAVQDPAYPVYVDTSLLLGQREVIKMVCNKANGFFPKLQKADLIYFCSPNNPTGYTATKEQLKELVDFAKACNAIILFDSAYAAFSDGVSSIYEIEGAKEVAIETSSFSKTFGFTGIRLGWSIVPKALSYEDGRPVHPDFLRIATTFFNGPSNIAEAGGIEAMQTDYTPIVEYYRENGRLLKKAFSDRYSVGSAPYLFVEFGQDSWQELEKLLEETRILAIPGSGFGPSGEGFLRFSALAKREIVEKACERVQNYSGATC